jgi:hypothetical protein
MRKHMAGLAMLALCLFASTTLATRADVTDKEINEKIVGKWSEEYEENGIKVKLKLDYKKDGGYEAEGTVVTPDMTINIKVSGKWKAENGELVETYEKIEPEGLMPAGTVTKDKVLSLDDKTHTIRTEKGKEHKRTRITDK